MTNRSDKHKKKTVEAPKFPFLLPKSKKTIKFHYTLPLSSQLYSNFAFIINHLLKTMNIGDKIPEILGTDQNGRTIKRSDYAGRKLVLYSYPKANTSGCTAEACSLQAHLPELAAAGYDVVGVSKDKEALQKKFADAQGLEFPLIADVDTTLLQALGCWGEKVACGRRTIGTLRTTYLVNEEGIIEKIFTPKEIKTKIHAEQILAYINQQG